jgi:hypothetical protein
MRSVLALRDFRLLWLSQAGSTIADRLVLVALALYVNQIGTPTDVGLVLAAQTIPFVVLLLIGGVWADRLPRHRLMVATDLIRGALHTVLAVLILSGDAEVWQIIVIEALFGAAMAFFRPAYTGLLPQTVPEELIQEAQALTTMTSNGAGLLGPAVAATLVLTVGAGAAFAIDAGTFFVSAALLLRVRPRERGGVGVRTRMLRELADGFQEIRIRPWAGLIIASTSLSLLCAIAPYQALGPDIADAAYGEAAVYGFLGTVGGAGSIVGSVMATRWQPARPLVVGCAAVLPWAVQFPLFALHTTLWVIGPLWFTGGVGIGLFLVWWETTLAREIPPAALSRVASFDWMGSFGLLPVGYILAGPIAEAAGARETLFAGGVLALLFQLWALWRLTQPKSGTPAVGVEASP